MAKTSGYWVTTSLRERHFKGKKHRQPSEKEIQTRLKKLKYVGGFEYLTTSEQASISAWNRLKK